MGRAAFEDFTKVGVSCQTRRKPHEDLVFNYHRLTEPDSQTVQKLDVHIHVPCTGTNPPQGLAIKDDGTCTKFIVVKISLISKSLPVSGMVFECSTESTSGCTHPMRIHVLMSDAGNTLPKHSAPYTILVPEKQVHLRSARSIFTS
ncbi:hypothetical protein BaRGS_00001853 [Batillaria attramentaria]|uniref:Uncharacterized protein n=1 Tax=Batillaria attramentaria TaxID=370345 RepID=A0ABD0M5T6_9CAEN